MLKALPASQWTFTTAAHLLNRAGFGGPPSEIEKLEKMGLEAAVASLLDHGKSPEVIPDPDWAKLDPNQMAQFRDFRELQQKMQQATEEERAALERKRRELVQQEQRTQRQRIVELRGWWLNRMVTGARPLQEKMTLFWHGHFATSVVKVRDAYLMWRQNDTFRRLATGNWLEMLKAVTLDPAMLIWLDQNQSRKQHPNENYAREVMELFALGEGHYSEQDILEAARAFTGLMLDRVRMEGHFRPFIHDTGVKTVLGKTGRLNWTDVLEQILAQPVAARFISAKLWTFFASENPSVELVQALASILRQENYEFKPLLRALFLSEEFYAPTVIRNQVKGPVQWLVSSARMLERPLPPPPISNNMLQNLGQELFAPPNVKGWDGGMAWITTNNLLARYNFAAALVYGDNRLQLNSDRPMARFMQERFNRMNRRPTPVNVAAILSATERASKTILIRALERRLLQGKLKPKQEQTLHEYLDSQGELDKNDILETIRLLMSTPEFQLT